VALAGDCCASNSREDSTTTRIKSTSWAKLFYAAYDLDPGGGTSRVFFGAAGDQHSARNHSAEDIARLLAVVPLADPDERAVLLTLAAAVATAPLLAGARW
jgi:hypothetical protein